MPLRLFRFAAPFGVRSAAPFGVRSTAPFGVRSAAPFGVLALLLLAACADTPAPAEPTESAPEADARPALTDAADSLAWRITRAAGGLDAWNALPVLRFDWAAVRDSAEVFRARHLWDRQTGRYRVEYPVGEDSMLVAVFDVHRFDPADPQGVIYVNGLPLDAAEAGERLVQAYQRHINDAYWFLAPLKLFDPGVRRALAPDSARAGTDVLHLSFEDVGLTPGDRYWLHADSTGRLVAWTYLLEGNTTGRSSHRRWEDYVTLETPRGPLHLATRKASDGRAILTIPLPADTLAADVFDDPRPRL